MRAYKQIEGELAGIVEELPAPMPTANNPQGTPAAKMFEVQISEEPNSNPKAWVVTLKGKAPGDGATFRGDILLKTNIAGEEEVKVPYYGFIRQKPRPMPVSSPNGQPSPSLLVPEQ